MRTSRKWVARSAVALAAFHLLLVLCGAFLFDLSQWGRLGEVLSYYSTLSGADRGFGFFAPAVDPECRARFVVIDVNGRSREVELEAGLPHEVALRVGGVINTYLESQDDDQLRRNVTASMAAKVLAQYPDASAVIVHIDLYRLVSMQEYRQGERGSWKEIYQARFERTS